ncbi:DNA-binding winged helix-turn-helix (wHTH) protein/tetratricopeptide (TPR) repeat protein [Povalibacter uvarum]|uniref:DNA-binding winged helix-turn-helix (WHTH) protein/tetratricopeptide (TPR) repeat protein n=1 Tax=Povalibacter uvarum TaxID=732238 RepID=A0A841HKC8_9GAMM|nr:winged helix-turn-helix domain-containing protein [Povalibacter uvarum]MBB6093661.1 DNA-binding winged helix-turn-helix (wHTH) protein/tetratricopeptide (TPR) repeat protein [Povalibacter uvarum]
MERGALQFDGWTVDRVSGEISRDGHMNRLPQQPLRVLIELTDRAGEVVTREQLVKALWPNGVVDFDNGLNVAVRKLRVALGDVGEESRYVETLPRVGYRFIGKLGAAAPPVAIESTQARSGRRMWILAAFALVALTACFLWFFWRSSDGARHVPSARAEELYVEGMHQRSRRDVDATALALAKLEEAIKEDPEYAEAWAGYSRTLSGAVVRQLMTPMEGLPKARAAAERALTLDPEVADAHVTLLHIHMDFDKDFAAATKDLEQARQLGLSTASLWHYSAMWHAQQGRVEEGLADMRRARGMEPMTLLLSSNYALILFNARRYDEVIALLAPIIEANPGFDTGRSVLARAFTATGRFDEALAQLQARKDIGAWQGDLGVLYAKTGRREDALREIARLETLQSRGFGESYELATIWATLGELDSGCESLARALTDGSFLVNWMRLDPRMDPLRGRKCFTDVEKKLYE